MMFTGQTILKIHRKNVVHVIIIWGFISTVIAGLFSGGILIALVNQNQKLPFNNLDSLAMCVQVRRCIVITHSPRNAFASMLTSTKYGGLPPGLLKVQFAMNSTKSLQIIPNPRDVQKLIFSSTPSKIYVYFGSKLYANGITQSNSEHSAQQYYFIFAGINDQRTFGIQKDSGLRQALDHASMYAKQYGLFDAAFDHYFTEIPESDIDLSMKFPDSISVGRFSSSLFLLLVGLGLASAVFVSETAVRKFWNNNVVTDFDS